MTPGQRVWFTSKLVLGAFRVAHLSRLLPYNSSTALGMLLEHRREPWVVYRVTDTGPDSDSAEILLMPFSRPSTVPPPADARRDVPDNARPEPHVKLHLHRDDFHLFEVSSATVTPAMRLLPYLLGLSRILTAVFQPGFPTAN